MPRATRDAGVSLAEQIAKGHRQEEARVGHNPMKPGRPSHMHHAMRFRAAKLVVNVDVQAGNRIASQYVQPALPGLVIEHKGGNWYEHAVLVPNWPQEELRAIARIYRDRGDAEHKFDEWKNQLGWTGFSTADLRRSQLMARMVALIHN